MDEPKFAQPIPNVTVAGMNRAKRKPKNFPMIYQFSPFAFYFSALLRIKNEIYSITVGRDANLPCVVEHLGTYKVSIKSAKLEENSKNKFMTQMFYGKDSFF